MIASAHFTQDNAFLRSLGQRLARQDIVQPPADVALPHLAPGRPPGEKTVIGRIQGATKINDALPDDPLEERSLLWPLPDDGRAALSRVYVLVGPRHIHVAAD